ncbi:sugar ABC transporter substrate-binding protein [Nonomuraea sp. NEAU-A123]|uniref:ABC transporter substrate-binding protein n=1 Tax=Nonomuraea sp. NEAU-A123 TaxID=2839649 RepID=UPI001BE415E4|nr:sugar ABC transporter substrate-binding protein [Nonomuraea sp. NEAU-A123]MBT2231931.1 sugar ABC transporter substrate-binding protein [Nonomuraea sp. NEAU-A123]
MRTRKIAAAAAGVTALLTLTACGGGAESGSAASGSTTVNWWTWSPDQAAAYTKCIPAFEKANPNIKVKITQYNVSDYFTKITSGFVAHNAPDAFQNSVTFFQSYANQHQLLAMDDLIKQSNYDLGVFAAGVDLWKFTDGKQYALPLDWAASALYYNKALVTKAGLTDKDLQNLTWNPADGGSFLSVVKRLTVDKKGVRGDQPGFDKEHVAVYGVGAMASDDNLGQTTWGSFAASTGFQLTDKPNWPGQFNYGDKRFIATMDFMRKLSDDGYAPELGQFTTGQADQIGSGSVAMVSGGSWDAASLAKLPGLKLGIAPVVKSPDGTRSLISNMNGNNIWSGTPHPQQTWKWVSYMGSKECQTTAATFNGSFFPSIAASMQALVDSSAKNGLDLSLFGEYQAKGALFPAPAYNNGAAMESKIRPQFEAFFMHQVNDEVWPALQKQTAQIISG